MRGNPFITIAAAFVLPLFAGTETPEFDFPELQLPTVGVPMPTPREMGEISSFPVRADRLNVVWYGAPAAAARYGAELYLRSLPDSESSDAVRLRISAGLADDPGMIELLGEKLELPPQGYALKMLSSNADEVSIAVVGGDPRGVFYGFATLRQMLTPDRAVQNFSDIKDYPLWRERYICDYFHDTSLAAFQWTAANKISGVSPICNEHWREPEWWEKNAEKIKAVKTMSDIGVLDFMIQLHIYNTPPNGPKLNIADEAEVDELIEACRRMAQNGVGMFMIAADDTTPLTKDGYVPYHAEELEKFGSVGAAHGYLMKRLYEALIPEFPHLRLSMVGAPYASDEHGVGTPEIDRYVTDWAKLAPKEVYWIWTGHRVLTKDVRKDKHEVLEKLLDGHKIYLFDNSNGFDVPMPMWETTFYPGMNEDDDSIVFVLGLAYGSRPWETAYYLGANSYLWNPENYNAEYYYKLALEILFGRDNMEPVMRLRRAMLECQRYTRAGRREGFAEVLAEFKAAFEELKKLRTPTGDPLPQWQIKPLIDYAENFAAFTPRRVEAAEKLGGVTVDGAASEGEWDGATAVELRDRTGKPDDSPVKMKVMHDGEKLYFFFDVTSELPMPEQKKLDRDEAVYLNDDSVELFIQYVPEHEARPENDYAGAYVHYAFDFAGNVYDAASAAGKTYDPPWQVATRPNDHGWQAEVEITAAVPEGEAFTPPVKGNIYRVNFHRTDNRAGKVQSFDGTASGFHEPNFFGEMTFR